MFEVKMAERYAKLLLNQKGTVFATKDGKELETVKDGCLDTILKSYAVQKVWHQGVWYDVTWISL